MLLPRSASALLRRSKTAFALKSAAINPFSSTFQQRQRLMATSAQPVTQPVTPSVFLEEGGGDPVLAAFQAHQAKAVRPSAAEQARTFMALAKHGVLATVDSSSGFPLTSVVEFAADARGLPIFAVSTLSPHTADLSSSGRVSFTVTSPTFASLADGRFMLQGTVRPVQDAEKPPLRELFLKKHPGSFYVDFGDFKWFILDNVRALRFNGGFAAAGKMTPDEYLAASPDPIAMFSAPVCGHMNADHGADNLAITAYVTGLTGASSVWLLDLDRLGMNAEATRNGQTFKLRLPFPRPAEDRKAIKEVIVEMTRAAKAAAAASAPPAPPAP